MRCCSLQTNRQTAYRAKFSWCCPGHQLGRSSFMANKGRTALNERRLMAHLLGQRILLHMHMCSQDGLQLTVCNCISWRLCHLQFSGALLNLKHGWVSAKHVACLAAQCPWLRTTHGQETAPAHSLRAWPHFAPPAHSKDCSNSHSSLLWA